MQTKSKFRAFWRYRPRLLTLVVLAVVGIPVALANFTSELVSQPERWLYKGVYGWPLMWHWHNLVVTPGPTGIVGWDYSTTRLTANLAFWLVMLGTPAGLCEWFLRRHRWSLQWSLRAMLVAIAMLAVSFGWFAAARDRANLQDPLIRTLEDDFQTVYLERPGPKWLEFVVPDRYRRRIIGIRMDDGATLDEESIQLLAKLPRLQHLQINVEHRTRPMASALVAMRRLKSLRFDEDGSIKEDTHVSEEFLAAIGTLTELERLSIADMTVTSKSLASLSGLTNLQSLELTGGNDEEDLCAQLPTWPLLKRIDYGHARLSSRDLRRLSAFPRMKAIFLSDAELSSDADLALLAELASLEELAINARILSTAGSESFGALRHLKSLHVIHDFGSGESGMTMLSLDRGQVSILDCDADNARRALQAIRRANPGITIDASRVSIGDVIPDGLEEGELKSSWLPASMEWLPPSLIDELRAGSS